MSFKIISVIGLGYIGLPTAAAIASRRTKVIGVDVNEKAVNTINAGEIHIVEPELDIVVNAAVSQGYLTATTKPQAADAFLIAVPTPFKDDHQPDLSYIEQACTAIAPVLKKSDLVILESTSPVGTTEKLARWLANARPDLSFPHQKGELSDIRVAYCPERVLPGHVMRELVQNDRIIGGMTPACSKMATELYSIFVQGECILTNARAAEMCKLTENAFRDVNIAFANELSIICDKLGINVWELIELANRHPRVNILKPGPGVGGHCIAVDPWFIISQSPDDAKLIKSARIVNSGKPQWVLDKVKLAIAELLTKYPDRTAASINIACFGLAFKADIDDLRESPALNITKAIADFHPGTVLAVEPNIDTAPETLSNENLILTSMEVALTKADIMLVLVDHKPFKFISASKMTDKIVIDTRGIWTG